jgi:hypothetical protein
MPWLGAGRKAREGSLFFFEKKNQKTFAILGAREPGHVRHVAEFFWFFFSKKNCLLASLFCCGGGGL